VYAHDGTLVRDEPSLVGSAGALAALLTLDPGAANAMYAGQILGRGERAGNELRWGEADDLYAQEWGWFATALYADALPDLWNAD
jgi:hypothetical protein